MFIDKHWVRISALVGALALAACNGGNGPSDQGSASLVLTDAASDQVDVFEVDVKDITLTKLSGSVVSVLSRAARVDFAQLSSLGELIVGAGLEAGVYTGMSMTLDFTNATVCLAGQTTPATVQDSEGTLLTGEVTVAVDFPAGGRPTVAVRRNHLFLLDLDLDQGLAVDSGTNTVTFSPVITLTVDPSNPKPIAMTGILASVDAVANTFAIEKRTPGDVAIGTFTIATTGTTVFQIDGGRSIGMTGLAALAPLIGSRVWVQGTLSATERMLTAVAVESGVGTPGNGQDWVFGHIVARDAGAGGDATLSVLGQSIDVSSGTRLFNTLHTVSVSHASTMVLYRSRGQGFDTDALQVGQAVTAFGTLAGTALDASTSSGVVRMHQTSVFGIAAGAPANNVLTLDLSRIDLRPIADFDFSVAANPQLDPAALTVGVSGLGSAGIIAGSKVRAIGAFNPVDVGGDDDLGATAIVNVSNQARLMLCLWLPPRDDAVTSASSTAISLDLTNALIHTVADGFAPVNLTTVPAPSIEPLLSAGIYSIVERGSLQIDTGFDTFTAALNARISPTSRVARVAALGTFDEPTQVFHAVVITVVLR